MQLHILVKRKGRQGTEPKPGTEPTKNTGQALLGASSLSLSLSGQKILKNISFSVAAGERIAIVGQNGAGKSTLLSAISGLLKADAGDVCWQGRSLASMTRRQIAQKIALLPQREDLPADLRVLDLILMGRAPYRQGLGLASTAEQDLAHKTLQQLDLAGFATRKTGSLSGGERQRVLIARALLQQPELLLLDEPAASLDLGHALYVAHLSQKLASQGVAVISILHDLNLVARFAERVWVMHRGELALDADLATALQPERLGPLLNIELLAGKLNGWPILIPR